MKLKGINLFEQHVDKIVVGVVAAAALGVVAMQFLTEPNKVTIGKDTLPPARAYEPVKNAAVDLLGRVNSETPPLPEAAKTDALSRFKSDLKRGVAPSPTLTAMGPVLALGAASEDMGTGGASGPVAAMVIPAPVETVARAFAGTVDPLEVIAHPELKKILPKEQPFDLFAVSVECKFDGTAFKQALQTDPDGSGPVRAMPLGWVKDTMEIVGVETEREQLGDNGEWGKATIIAPIPGRPDLLGEFRKSVRSVGDVSPMIQQIQARADDVQRPDYYTLIAGPTWQPPSEASDGMSLSQRQDAITAKINKIDEQVEGWRRQLARQTKEAAAPRTPAGPSEGGRGGKGGGGGNEAPAAPSKPTGGKAKENPIDVKINKALADREKLVKDKEELAELMASGGTKKTVADSLRPTLLENPKVRLWTHDVGAEPGATYRYRVRIVTNNPFFGRDAALAPAQKELAKQPLSIGAWSDWTEPVTVDRKSYYFVTSASDRDGMGPARASVELMEFYYGFYRQAKVGVAPGDVLMGEAKLPANLMVFDIEKLAAGAPATSGTPAAPAPGGKGSPAPPRGTPTGAGGKNEVEKAAAEGAKAIPEKRTIAMEALLVDVQAGQNGSGARAVVREVPGAVVVRSPEDGVHGSLLARLRESAKQGESQGQPQVKAREPKPDAPALERPGQGQPGRGQPPPDGGGGGGG